MMIVVREFASFEEKQIVNRVPAPNPPSKSYCRMRKVGEIELDVARMMTRKRCFARLIENQKARPTEETCQVKVKVNSI